MRLLNAHTLKLEWFNEKGTPAYAILSHTWGHTEDEVTYQELQEVNNHADRTRHPTWSKPGFDKIRQCCIVALRENINYVWVDTCCIDKTSSAELAEAINSMFRWYEEAQICYAFLADVHDPRTRTEVHDLKSNSVKFRRSKWFKRGWTLQELIAPGNVNFYSSSWTLIGTRSNLWEIISEITTIDKNMLQSSPFPSEVELRSHCVAKRMSWAASRETTRVEDQAYSLLGLFGINMPLLYGEGTRAFTRLQEEIIKQSTDLSILAWSHLPLPVTPQSTTSLDHPYYELLAVSPAEFTDCHDVILSREMHVPRRTTLTMTSAGLRIDGAFIVESVRTSTGRGPVLSLECGHEKDVTKLLALKFRLLDRVMRSDNDIETRDIGYNQGSETMGYVGWQRETADRKRLIGVDLLEPRQTHRWPILTIARDTPRTPIIRIPPINNAYAWVRFSKPPKSLQKVWRVLKVHPEGYWKVKDLTFGFQEAWVLAKDFAYKDFIEGEYIFLGANYREIRCAVAFSDTTGGEYVLHFANRYQPANGYGWDHKFPFTLVPYDHARFPETDEHLLDRHNDVKVRAHNGIVIVRRMKIPRPGLHLVMFEITMESPEETQDKTTS